MTTDITAALNEFESAAERHGRCYTCALSFRLAARAKMVTAREKLIAAIDAQESRRKPGRPMKSDNQKEIFG